MNTAHMLLSYGFPVAGTKNQTYLLSGVIFTRINSSLDEVRAQVHHLYFHEAWRINIENKSFLVSEVFASQIAFAIISGGNIDIIKEHLSGYEAVETPTQIIKPKTPEIPDADYEIKQQRRSVVRELVKKAENRLTLVACSDRVGP